MTVLCSKCDLSKKIHRNSLQPDYMLHWYRIKEILVQGGFGITYLAEDTNLESEVAKDKYSQLMKDK